MILLWTTQHHLPVLYSVAGARRALWTTFWWRFRRIIPRFGQYFTAPLYPSELSAASLY